jgi:hypothetical protein
MTTGPGLSKNGIALMGVGILAALAASRTGLSQGPGGERIRQQEVFTGANVLTPGAHDDWPLKAKEGETVIVSVSSPAFDPAVELIGPDDRSIAKNDDVRRGEQDALLLARLAPAGEYQVRVSSSNGAAGGQYSLTLRRFVATDLPIGTRTAGTLGKTLAHWHRFPAEADRTLVLSARAASFDPALQVIAPNGEPVGLESLGAGQRNAARAVFRATQAGPYYARISRAQGGDPRDSYSVTVAPARVIPAAIGEANADRRLDAGGLDLRTFTGEPGDLLRVRARASSGEMTSQISYLPPADASGRPQDLDGPAPPLAVLPSDPKAGGELVALLNLPGTYQVAVSQPSGLGVGYSFEIARVARPLAADAETAGSLRLGGSDYRTIDGAPGQVLRVEGTSEAFDPDLELYGPQGSPVARNDDGASGRDPQLTALLTERGRYLLRVHSHGDGGGGPYRLRRIPDPARPLALGGRGEGTLGPGASDLWSFDGRAGQAAIVSARSPDCNVRVSLFGPDATEIASDDDGGEGTDSLLSVQFPADGPYTLWVSSVGGSGRYTLQLIEAR